eukprot:TRINITY_DN31997_c0_g1_i1.p1 TRINITY_DN31997_c0_g1~~TRINITY_DN31997_c0_g1_i1.p1  ORF type:complete len:1344 (+),score=496.45 TRINITY_DN31997_c0_g1_i1:102-4034(+)
MDGEFVEKELFTEVMSQDFLKFAFRSSSTYEDQLTRAQQKTGKVSAITVRTRSLPGGQRCVWMAHDFGFMGGSLGCAEGEKLVRGFEYGRERGLAVVIACKSGGARMQEGILSLMQMAKVSVAVGAHRSAGLPFIAVLVDPTYGGVSASYAMQADVRIGVSDARIGFAGPAVILNTMFEMDQQKYDSECPAAFQSAQYLQDHGQLDIVLPLARGAALDDSIDDAVSRCLRVLVKQVDGLRQPEVVPLAKAPSGDVSLDYTRSRQMSRPQAQDVIENVFDLFVELEGDGRVGNDRCIRGGLATLHGQRCVVIATTKGHTPSKMKIANYGMPSPAGYRKALRLMKTAERFGLPVVTFVDTCGALPSFSAEEQGQSEAIATNLVEMAMLKVPIVTVVIGEGGSGGALGIAMGDRIAMMSGAYYGVISPEGAASILGRYKGDEDKKQQFPVDCRALATAQHIYAPQLKELGVVDEIIWELEGREHETYKSFPLIKSDITEFIMRSLETVRAAAPEALVEARYGRFRQMGRFGIFGQSPQPAPGAPGTPVGAGQMTPLAAAGVSTGGGTPIPSAAYQMEPTPKQDKVVEKPKPAPKPPVHESKLLRFIAETTVRGESSAHKGQWPFVAEEPPPPAVDALANPPPAPARDQEYAKLILDRDGPEALAKWVRRQDRVLITDTTMRDAHQSLLATRVRTVDILDAAKEFQRVFGAQTGAFSVENWGGATFDVAYRFLHECPWERLREMRKAMPDVCFQMLVRGANAVGYKSYPNSTVAEFCKLAAAAGMDVFRIFDCFNDLEQMRVCIKAVREAKKVAEVCICFTGDFLREDETIYTLDYYRNLAKEVSQSGAHMIGVKDMAGLLKPSGAAPLMKALREGAGNDIPIHFHTHATSSASLATVMAMSEAGCDVVDACIASMADGTSQPSLNAFLADLQTARSPRWPGIPYLALERLDTFWSRIRTLYKPFESGILSGTARVYDHEIPGGQYSNLLVQCKSMGLASRWNEVVDMYRDVNRLFGNIIKVTPSSKCVGDMALYLVQRNFTCEDVRTRGDQIAFPASVLDLMSGGLSYPHHGFPTDLQKIVLKDRKPLPRGTRPGDALPDDDFAAVKAQVSELMKREATDEEMMSSLMYPKVFSDYCDFIAQNTDCVTRIDSSCFWYGMQVSGKTSIHLPPAAAAAVTGAERPPSDTDVDVTLQRVGPLSTDSTRAVDFLVSAAGAEPKVVTIRVKDAAAGGGGSGVMADPDDAKQVGSPMSGSVEAVACAEGDTVKKGQKLAVVGAMKMEVECIAPMDGKVTKVLASKGMKVEEGSLLIVLG